MRVRPFDPDDSASSVRVFSGLSPSEQARRLSVNAPGGAAAASAASVPGSPGPPGVERSGTMRGHLLRQQTITRESKMLKTNFRAGTSVHRAGTICNLRPGRLR